MQRITRTYTLRASLNSPAPRRLTPSRIHAALVLIGCALVLAWISLSGCSTTSQARIGLRPGFEGLRIQRIAVLPFGATSSLGDGRAELIGLYEDTAVSHLTRMYATVHTPKTLREQLPEGVDARMVRDAFELRGALSEAFEESESSGLRVRERTAFVKRLGEHLKVDAFLLGQVVYHTDAMCDGSTESIYTEYVFVEGGDRPRDARVPCAVSHFQAKLVDARTGRVVWFNRALREVRAVSAHQPTPNLVSNARRAVQLVLSETEDSLMQVFARSL